MNFGIVRKLRKLDWVETWWTLGGTGWRLDGDYYTWPILKIFISKVVVITLFISKVSISKVVFSSFVQFHLDTMVMHKAGLEFYRVLTQFTILFPNSVLSHTIFCTRSVNKFTRACVR